MNIDIRMYVHAAMVGGVMLYVVSMLLVDNSSLVQLVVCE